MRSWIILAAGLFIAPIFATASFAAEPTKAELDATFEKTIKPFLATNCFECHSGDKPVAGFNLESYSTIDSVVKGDARWAHVLTKLKNGEMPPPDAIEHPTLEARQEVVKWITQLRGYEAHLNAGDPGVVLARRLSNFEYNYTIRDLTGFDMQPAKEFPVDPANQAGFDTSGESLTMSSGLMTKYMEAARFVSEHMVLLPNGFTFASYPVVADTDRDKFCVNRIVDFYKRQPTDLAEYFLAAWMYENRAATGRPNATLDQIAADQKVSAKYLAMVSASLAGKKEEIGPIAGLQMLWRNLPVPDANGMDRAVQGCQQMRDLVIDLREKTRPDYDNITARTMNTGTQCLVLWKDRAYASTRFTYETWSAFSLEPTDLMPNSVAAKALAQPKDYPTQLVYDDAFKRFAVLYPDVFMVTERAGMYLDPTAEAKLTGRLLGAGFHSQSGTFRDDIPLCQLIMSDADNKELDELWKELDFVSSAVNKQYTGMMWFERSDSTFMIEHKFDFARPEDKDCTSEEKIMKLKAAFYTKAQDNGAGKYALDAIVTYFDEINARVRWMEKARADAEPSHVAQLVEFAQKAYRRPLTQAEKDGIVSFYHALRTEDQLDHESAVRDTLVSILMSPYFCYRVNTAPQGDQVKPLSDYELASRLSYFLWSSMPDDQLLAHAATGDLHDPKVLTAQTQRMIEDERIRGLALEFGGNWLDFRRFEEINSVDRGRFPSFTNDLREAMFEEPVRFFIDIAQHDGSILDFLNGKYTFVNPVLAKHYGMPEKESLPSQWWKVDDADKYDRGSLLGMAVFQTKNAPGLRTSPVKRGYWVVKRLLGEEIPPPPPNVPALPPDESKLGDLTLPQMLAAHRQDKNCAACHDHFDAIGLAFEGFGPIGDKRSLDMGGKPVQDTVTFRDGSKGTGVDGLRTYLMHSRKDDFVDNLCRKLLSKALDRTLVLSDDPLVDEMRAKLEANGYKFNTLVDAIVTSPQFVNKKGQGTVAVKSN